MLYSPGLLGIAISNQRTYLTQPHILTPSYFSDCMVFLFCAVIVVGCCDYFFAFSIAVLIVITINVAIDVNGIIRTALCSCHFMTPYLINLVITRELFYETLLASVYRRCSRA